MNILFLLSSLIASKGKIDQVISVVLRKLAKKDIERFGAGGVKAWLMQEALGI